MYFAARRLAAQPIDPAEVSNGECGGVEIDSPRCGRPMRHCICNSTMLHTRSRILVLITGEKCPVSVKRYLSRACIARPPTMSGRDDLRAADRLGEGDIRMRAMRRAAAGTCRCSSRTRTTNGDGLLFACLSVSARRAVRAAVLRHASAPAPTPASDRPHCGPAGSDHPAPSARGA